MSSRSIAPWLSDVFTTTNATATVSTGTSFALPTGTTVHGDIHVLARNTTTGVGASFSGAIRAHNIAGTLTLQAILPVLVVGGDVTLATIVVDVINSGTTIQPRVTGIAATNIEWFVDVCYRVH